MTDFSPIAAAPGTAPAPSRFATFCQSLLLAAALWAYQLPLRSRAAFGIFQARDLDRAKALLAGNPILFGPELTGGGNLPGPFFYYLLAFPLKLGLGWEGALHLMIALNALALAGLWAFAARRFGFVPACLLSVAYAISPGIYTVLVSFFNASYIFVFAVAALVGFCLAFAEEGRARAPGWLLACGAIALGGQLHFTVLFFLPAGLLLQAGAKRLGLAPLAPRAFRAGLLLFAALLAPFAFWLASRAAGHPVGQLPPPFSGSVAKSPVSLFNLALYLPSEAYGFAGLAGTLLRLASWLRAFLVTKSVLSLPAALLALFLFARRRELLDPHSPQLTHARRCLRVLTVCLAVTFIPAATNVVVPFWNRYASCFAVTLLFLMAPLLRLAAGSVARWANIAGLLLTLAFAATRARFGAADALACLAGYAVLGLLLALQRDRRPQLRAFPALWLLAAPPLLASVRDSSGAPDIYSYPGARELEAVSTHIQTMTGWDYETAKQRIFYLNLVNECTPRYLYEAVAARRGLPPKPNAAVDGFFVGMLRPGEQDGRGIDPAAWLLENGVEPSLARGLKTGGIRIGKQFRVGERVLVAEYIVADKRAYPEHFQNIGDAYRNGNAALEEAERHGNTRTSAVAMFNDCPAHASKCRIALTASGRDLTDPREEVVVRVLGEPLTQPSASSSPDWTQALQAPYVAFHCDDGRREILLADSIGFHTKGDTLFLNGSFLAPFERRLLPGCRSRVRKIELGYKGAVFNTMEFPEAPLEAKNRIVELP